MEPRHGQLGVWGATRQPLRCVRLLVLLSALSAHLAVGQMVSPLQGQGPSQDTRDVFLSVYLDRLLSVGEFQWEAAFVMYVTWNDSQAHYTITNTTADVAAGRRTCQRPCTDWAGGLACCDGIYIPSFFFRNAYRFPQDRPTGAKIYALAPPNGSVLWTQVVHGLFYQPMKFAKYPFDSFDLLAVLEFLDSSTGGHPGLAVHASSTGKQLYTLGLGDAVSGWHVDQVSLEVIDSVNSGSVFKMSSAQPSHPLDPLPLSTGQAAVLRGTLPGPSTTSRVNPVRLVFLKIRVSRFWGYHVLNTILPVALLGWISLIVMVLPRRDLAARLGVIVTLFLALAAVQFVISEHQPSSSYILPTQQQVILTWALLALMALESIVVHNIETWKERAEEAQRRREARDRFLATRRRRCQARGTTSACSGTAATTAAAGQSLDGVSKAEGSDMLGHAGNGSSSGGRQRVAGGAAGPRLTRLKSLQEDRDFDAYVAYMVDRAALLVLFVLYTVGTVLVYTTQAGYTDLWPS